MTLTTEPNLGALVSPPIGPLVRALTQRQSEESSVPWIHRLPALPEGRYELKFTIPIAQAYRVDAWLRAHRAAFHPLHSPRRVNSLYFDTHDLAGYVQSLDGNAARAKVRLRWYGEAAEPAEFRHRKVQPCIENPILEVKRKQGALGWKEQYRISGAFDLTGGAWPTLLRALRRELPPLPRHVLDAAPIPVIINSYDRAYFTSADQIIRVTVDRNLAAYDQRRSPRPNLSRRIPLPDQLVVEVKCPAANRETLGEFAAEFLIRTQRCSKYVSATAAALQS